ncbi:MAG: OmpA family protein [Sulfurovum sp.]|nr:OmpA family protein [Sulfurovum sp.]
MKTRTVFKNRFFWLLLFTFILVISFIFFGQHLKISAFEKQITRILYGSILFFSVVIFQLLYLLFTKPEEREKRLALREARKEEKRIAKEKRKKKKLAIKTLKKKFYDALKVVRTSNIYKKRASYNYELPWYLVLGGEDDEQELLLKNSGLDFPKNIEYKDEADLNAGSFKWFLAEEGVFVTIPKDYITLDKNNESHPIWLTFLKLFKKERWRRPINGIIFTINATAILNKDEKESNEYAKVVRERIAEISKTFSSKIPVYMIVTGVETIPAFYTFFNTLTLEEKREILGITFEDNIENISKEVIESKIAHLLQKLENETLGNIHSSWEKEERKKIFFFLEEFQHFLVKISTFGEKTFSKTRYFLPLMLRGIYFTDISHGTKTHYALTKHGEQITSGLFVPKIFERLILSETQLARVNDEYRKKFTYFWLAFFTFLILGLGSTIYYWTSFIQDEADEVKKIEDIYGQYVSLQENNQPKVTLVRKAKDLKDAVEIGKLGEDPNGEVNFITAKATLTKIAHKKLDKVLDAILLLDDTTKLKVVGHTDSIGSEEYNLDLSLRRAQSVKDYFVEHDIDEERIVTDGKGENSPLANNQTVEGRSLNRRVEVYAYGLSSQGTDEDMDSGYKESYVIENHLSDLQRILAMLDALSSMRRDANDTIYREVWKPGFWKVAQRDAKVKVLYKESLESLLLPRVATIIEKELLDNINDKKDVQDNLKAYLMLADSTHRDKTFLSNYMLDRWGNLKDTEIQRFNTHFDNLLSLHFKPAKLQQKSIYKARKKILSNAGTAGFIYSILQKEVQKKGLYDFQFLEVLDAFPNSLRGADYKIPGFYTKDGYQKIILLEARFIVRQAMAKNWILGNIETVNDKEISRIYEKVLNLYFMDYRKYWTKALTQLHAPTFKTSTELSEQLELFSSNLSPIVYVLRAFKENTFLLTPKEESEAALKKKYETGLAATEVVGTRLGGIIDRTQRLGTKTMQAFASDSMVHDLRSIFKPYHELLDKKNAPSRKFKIVLRHVEKVYQQMLTVDTAPNPKQIAFDIIRKKKKSNFNSFKLKSNLLPMSLLTWYNQSLSSSWQYFIKLADEEIDKTYNDEIWTFYTEKIKDRFPLNTKTESYITLDDFTAFFKKGGLLDKFYKEKVTPFVKVDYSTGKFKLRSMDGTRITIDKQMIKSMIYAKKIQKLFFQSDTNKLHFQVNISPHKLSPNLAAMDIIYEDQELLYEHGPIQSKEFIWPTQYTSSIAKFTFYDIDSDRVVKVRGKGPWGLLKLFSNLNKKMIGSSKMRISYRKNAYFGSFDVEGKIVSFFHKNSPIKHFKLNKKN